MEKQKRRDIPTELRPQFIKILQGLRAHNDADTDEDLLWEVAARILHSEIAADWLIFKQLNQIGLR